MKDLIELWKRRTDKYKELADELEQVIAKRKEKGRTCECCGGKDYLAGVASSGLGAFGILWCEFCLSMVAEPKWAIDALVESCDGIENVRENLGLTYFDKLKDSYVDYRTKKVIPIKIKNGQEFKTKTELVEYLKRNKNKGGNYET